MVKATLVLVAACCVLLGLQACGSVDDTDAPRTGQSQSAILPGSCANHCASQSPGGCWCDTYCTQYGDCCSDYAALCSNDACTNAKVPSYAPFATTQSTTYATVTASEPGLTCASSTGNPIQPYNTVWFKFTPTHSGTAVLDMTGTNYGVNVGVHTGSCGKLTQVACANLLSDDKSFRFEAQANKTYYVQVGDWYGDGGGGGTLKFRLDYFRWNFKPTPPGSQPYTIVVDSTDDNVWYVGTTDGVYITNDGGNTWIHYLAGTTSWGIANDPSIPGIVYIGSNNVLFVTANHGTSWRPLEYFPNDLTIYSIHVSSSGEIYVGHYWGSNNAPGIYKANSVNSLFNFYPFNIPPLPGNQDKGLIIWDIAQDPQNGYLYVGAEPKSKPSGIPYDPPTLRSKDGGNTWQDISGQQGANGSLPHHATRIQVSRTHEVYFQMEGGAVYTSTNYGDTSQRQANNAAWDLVLDPNGSGKLYSTNVSTIRLSLSTDDGAHFRVIGPPDGGGAGLMHLTFNSNGGKLYASVESSTRPGVYVIDAGDTFAF